MFLHIIYFQSEVLQCLPMTSHYEETRFKLRKVINYDDVVTFPIVPRSLAVPASFTKASPAMELHPFSLPCQRGNISVTTRRR
jgi:hypothetical protein